MSSSGRLDILFEVFEYHLALVPISPYPPKVIFGQPEDDIRTSARRYSDESNL